MGKTSEKLDSGCLHVHHFLISHLPTGLLLQLYIFLIMHQKFVFKLNATNFLMRAKGEFIFPFINLLKKNLSRLAVAVLGFRNGKYLT